MNMVSTTERSESFVSVRASSRIFSYACKNGYCVVISALSDESDPMLSDWKELEGRALSPNPYLSSDFVLTATTTLVEAENVYVLGVYNQNNMMVALAIVTRSEPYLKYPFSHFQLLTTSQTFSNGILIDKLHSGEAMAALFECFLNNRATMHTLSFSDVPIDSYLLSAVDQYASKYRCKVYFDYSYQRACIETKGKVKAPLCSAISRKRAKDLERCCRNLNKLGIYEWRFHQNRDVDDRIVGNFLELENRSWKGTKGTSIMASKGGEAFFRTVIRRFADREQVFVTEVVLNGVVIASSVNFKIDRTVYAFKVAWDSDYRSYSPGMLNEYEFLKHIDRGEVEVDFIDSGAAQDSFIEKLWPDRQTLAKGYIVFGFKRIAAVTVLTILRDVLRNVRKTTRAWRRDEVGNAE